MLEGCYIRLSGQGGISEVGVIGLRVVEGQSWEVQGERQRRLGWAAVVSQDEHFLFLPIFNIGRSYPMTGSLKRGFWTHRAL